MTDMKYIVSIFMLLAALACVPVVAAQTVADAMQLAEDEIGRAHV